MLDALSLRVIAYPDRLEIRGAIPTYVSIERTSRCTFSMHLRRTEPHRVDRDRILAVDEFHVELTHRPGDPGGRHAARDAFDSASPLRPPRMLSTVWPNRRRIMRAFMSAKSGFRGV